MIKITIEQVTTEKYMETRNFVVKSTPTEIVKSTYNNYSGEPKKEIQCIEEFVTREVEMSRTVTRELLSQEIEDDTRFDLVQVISAINRIKDGTVASAIADYWEKHR